MYILGSSTYKCTSQRLFFFFTSVLFFTRQDKIRGCMQQKGKYPKADQLSTRTVTFLHILMNRSILPLLKGVLLFIAHPVAVCSGFLKTSILLLVSLQSCGLAPTVQSHVGNIAKKGTLSSAVQQASSQPVGCPGWKSLLSLFFVIIRDERLPVLPAGALWKSAGELSHKNDDVLFILSG